MSGNLYWFFDVFILGMMLIFLYIGSKRGFLKSAVYIVLVLASFFVSWFCAEAAAPLIYDKFIKDSVNEAFSQSVSDSDPADIVSQAVAEGDYGVEMSKPEINMIIEKKSDFFTELADEMRKNGSPDSADSIKTGVEQAVSPKVMDTLLGDFASSDYIINALEKVGGAAENIGAVVNSFITGTKEEVAAEAESRLIAPIVIWALKAVIFLLLMLLCRLIITPVSNIFKFVNRVPLIGPVNSLLGAMLGAAEGLIFLYVVALAVKAVINISGDSLIFFNSATVEQTKLFIKFYNFNVMSFLP